MIEIAMRRSGARLMPVDDHSAEDLIRVPADRDVLVKIVSQRNMKLLRFLWALAGKVADACDWLHDKDDAMDELKIRARHVKYLVNPTTGEVRIVPKSLSKIDGAALNRLANRMVYVICRDIVPGLDESALRAEIVSMIAGPEDSNTDVQPAAGNKTSPLGSMASDQEQVTTGSGEVHDRMSESTSPTNSNSVEPGAPQAQAQPSEPAAVGNVPPTDTAAGNSSQSSAPPPVDEEAQASEASPAGLPSGWPILYAAALRRAQKKESLAKYASAFWDERGGWDAHKGTEDGATAAAIFDVFRDNFGNKEHIELLLRELI